MIDPNRIRKKILTMAYKGQTAHVACALSIVEILCVLYSEYPGHEIILSKGHGVMALYAILNEMGRLPDSDLDNYFSNGSSLFGLASGFGSLGHGLPIAVGRALALKRLGSDKKVFCIVGDGEMQEGSNWEALRFAETVNRDNLYLIIDGNGWQAMDRIKTRSSSNYPPGWPIDGHCLYSISAALKCPGYNIFASTLKGNGVSFMEDLNEWHYKRMNKEDYDRAILAIGEC